MGQQRIKVIIGCIGAFVGVVAAILIFLLFWKRKELKHQGLPRILQESNPPIEERDSALPLPVKFQNGHSPRDSLVPLIHKRNSSYRSQLSSSASGGTILTFADGMLSYYHHSDLLHLSVTHSKIKSSTIKINAFFATFDQSNVWQLLPGSKYCRTHTNQIKSLSKAQTT